MENYFVGSTGVKIPKLIYGTAWKENKTTDLVYLALKKGFRGLDTACQPKHYKEPLVGDGIALAYKEGLKREDLFIQTKFTPFDGQDPNDTPYDPKLSISNQIRESFKVSKINLKTDYIDSLVLHSPYNSWEENKEAWTALEDLVDSGEVKQIGISNCYDINVLSKIFNSSKIKPSILQNRFYKETNYDQDTRKFCNENHIFYQCFWTLKVNDHILDSQIVKDIAQRENKTKAQVFFRCLNEQKIHPLMGTTSEQHMQEGLDVFSFSLSQDDCDSIKNLGPY